jgi:hypothetical protein
MVNPPRQRLDCVPFMDLMVECALATIK